MNHYTCRAYEQEGDSEPIRQYFYKSDNCVDALFLFRTELVDQKVSHLVGFWTVTLDDTTAH